MSRPSRYLPAHPLAGRNGKVTISRLVIWDRTSGICPPCHWCQCDLTWKTLCADHLNSDEEDNRSSNLVASCRGCNANRDDGTGAGRRDLTPKTCPVCNNLFSPSFAGNHKKQATCSHACANRLRGPYGSTKAHGTIGRYKYGCRCDPCRGANAALKRADRRRYAAQRKVS